MEIIRIDGNSPMDSYSIEVGPNSYGRLDTGIFLSLSTSNPRYPGVYVGESYTAITVEDARRLRDHLTLLLGD
jgi:hypothetical protein